MNCAICLEPLKKDVPEEYKSVLSCNHEFHPTCLLKWFEKSTTCPTCRKDHIKKDVIQTGNIQEPGNVSHFSSLMEIINSSNDRRIPNRFISHQIPSYYPTTIHTSNNFFQFPSLSTLSEDITNRSSENELLRHVHRDIRRRNFISLILEGESMV